MDPTWPHEQRSRTPGAFAIIGRVPRCCPTECHTLIYKRWEQRCFSSLDMGVSRWSRDLLFDAGTGGGIDQPERRLEVRQGYNWLYSWHDTQESGVAPTHYFELFSRRANGPLNAPRETIWACGANLTKQGQQSDVVARACFDYISHIISDLANSPDVGRFMLACPNTNSAVLPDSSWEGFIHEESHGKRYHFWSMALVYRWLHIGTQS